LRATRASRSSRTCRSRALLAIVDVGDDAPPEFYGALAAIVASLAREVRR